MKVKEAGVPLFEQETIDRGYESDKFLLHLVSGQAKANMEQHLIVE